MRGGDSGKRPEDVEAFLKTMPLGNDARVDEVSCVRADAGKFSCSMLAGLERAVVTVQTDGDHMMVVDAK